MTAGAVLLGYAVRAGLPSPALLTALLAVLATQVLPGALVWRTLRPRAGWWLEDLAMGFAIGSVLAVGTQIVAGLTRLPWLSAGAAAAIVIALLAIPATRHRITSARTSPLSWWWGAIVAGASLVGMQQLQLYFRTVPLSWASGARVPHVDADLHLALAGQLATRGPTRFPWVESEPLAYHWFSHAWVAQVSSTSSAGLDEVLFRFMPALMPLVVSVCVATAAIRLSGREWTGPVAAVLTMAGGDLNVFGKLTPGYPVAPLSPSLALAAPMLVAIVVVLALRWRGALGVAAVPLLATLCLGAAGTKGSTVPLVVAGLVLALAAMTVTNRARVRELLRDLAIVAGTLLVAWVAVFRGSDAGLQPDLVGAAGQTAASAWFGGLRTGAEQAFVIVVSMAAVFARAVGTIALVATHRGRRDPLSWLLFGASAVGAIAVGVFSHPGASQWYFARSAVPLMALGSALGLVVVLNRLGEWERPALALGVVAGPVLAFVPFAVFGPLGPGEFLRAVAMLGAAAILLAAIAVLAWVFIGRRPIAVNSVLMVAVLAGGVAVVVHTLVQYDAPPPRQAVGVDERGAVSTDQIDAARWIRDHSDVDDMVMTNRHCMTTSRPRHCDNRRFVVAAYSERQILLEGWTPAPKAQEIAPHGRDSITVDYWKPELLELNDRFIARPTAAAARELQELGVRWIFVDHTRPYARTLEPYARLRFQNSGVDVYELVS